MGSEDPEDGGFRKSMGGMVHNCVASWRALRKYMKEVLYVK